MAVGIESSDKPAITTRRTSTWQNTQKRYGTTVIGATTGMRLNSMNTLNAQGFELTSREGDYNKLSSPWEY
eukprot:scaffold4855_cov99-Cylindrotheca_fusiformis.AAC.2